MSITRTTVPKPREKELSSIGQERKHQIRVKNSPRRRKRKMKRGKHKRRLLKWLKVVKTEYQAA